MNQTKTTEKLTAGDLQYLKIATGAFLANKENEEIMPETFAAMDVLYEKIGRIYRQEVNA